MRLSSAAVATAALLVLCVVVNPVRADFWTTFDTKYSKIIKEQTQIYLDHKQQVELFGALAEADTEYAKYQDKLWSVLAAEPTPANKPLFGLNAIGHGFNWWDESLTSQPLVNWGRNLKNTYVLPSTNEMFDVPDEIIVIDTPMINRDGEVSIQENYNEYANMRSKKFGLGIGYMGIIPLSGSVEMGRVRSVFRKETIHTAQVDVNAAYYVINMLPHNFLKLRPDIVDTFTALPRYDAGTRQIWFNAIKRLGSHIVIGVDMGGRAHMDSVIDTIEFGQRGSSWTTVQVKISYESMTAFDESYRREKKLQLDPVFDRNTQSNVRYEGGDTSIPIWDQPKWLSTLPSNLVPLRYRTSPISEFFPPGRLHDDLHQAINEFLVFSAPQPLAALNLGPEEEIGTAAAGAGVGVTSYRIESRQVCKKCLFVFCCGKRTVYDHFDLRRNLISGGDSFIFGYNDANQQAWIGLPGVKYVKRIRAHVSPPGRQRPTTQCELLTAGLSWDSWGPGKKPVTEVMEATSKWPVKASEVRFHFGPAPPGSGSMVHRIHAWGVSQSAPAGGIDSLNRFVINGWAADPIEPQAILQIRVYVDNVLHAQGTTGGAREDIRTRYEFPAGTNCGFSIPLNIPKDASRLHQIYVVWKGITQEGRSETIKLWSIQPPGRLLEADPSKVRGWAYLHDQPAGSYPVDIFVNGQKVASGNTGNLDSQVVRQVFGVNAAYGFEIPLQIKTAGVHQITAVMTAPDGTRLQFEDTLSVDLRFPLGEIFDVAPGWVAGFAYDPNTPNVATNVHIYVDGVLQARGKTTIMLPDYNSRYLIEGAHGFNISLRMQGGKLHMVSVYASIGVSLKLIGEKSIAVGLNDRGSSKVTNGIINFAGVGFNPCYGEWRLRVIDLNYSQKKVLRDSAWKDTNMYMLEIPDEFDLTRNSEQIYTNTTNVFRTIKEWSQYKMNAWKVGFSVGLFGFSSSYMKARLEKHFIDEMSRVAEAQRIITLFEMTAAPPQIMKFTSYAGHELSQLPPYNAVTRPRWFRFFDLFGLVYPKRMQLGGRMDFEALYRTVNTSYARYDYEKSQVGFTFTFYISLSGSFEKATSEAALDKSFLNSLTQSVRFIGGRPELFNTEESVEWMKSIRQNPTIVSMELESISELLWKSADAQKKAWFDEAALDYMRTCTPENWVCSRYNVANPTDGARIIGVSSRQSGEPDSSVQNLLLEPNARIGWNGDINFQFGDNDTNQYMILDLGNMLRIKAIAIDVEPYPSETGVWDFIRLETSSDKNTWQIWGSVGDHNGRADVTKPHYDFPLLVEQQLRYIRFSFGGPGKSGKGAKIVRLYAYNCVNQGK